MPRVKFIALCVFFLALIGVGVYLALSPKPEDKRGASRDKSASKRSQVDKRRQQVHTVLRRFLDGYRQYERGKLTSEGRHQLKSATSPLFYRELIDNPPRIKSAEGVTSQVAYSHIYGTVLHDAIWVEVHLRYRQHGRDWQSNLFVVCRLTRSGKWLVTGLK